MTNIPKGSAGVESRMMLRVIMTMCVLKAVLWLNALRYYLTSALQSHLDYSIKNEMWWYAQVKLQICCCANIYTHFGHLWTNMPVRRADPCEDSKQAGSAAQACASQERTKAM